MRRAGTLVAIGLAAGFMAAMFGVGGGVIMVPAFLAAGLLTLKPATATSLAAIGFTAVFGAVRYAIEGEVFWFEAALVGVPAVAGTIAGIAIQRRLAQRPLQLGFACLLVVVGARLVIG